MVDHLRRNVIGYLALFCFALGGTAIALPGKNKVDSGDIKNGQVKTDDLADATVTAAKLAQGAVQIPDGSINSAKVADDSLTGADINESSLNLPAQTAQVREVIRPPDFFPNLGAPQISSISNLPAVIFSSSVDQNAVVSTELPRRVAGTPVTVTFVVTAGQTGDVVWTLEHRAQAIGQSLTQLFVSLPEQTVAVPTANELSNVSFSIPATAMDGKDVLGLIIGRHASAGGDTNGGTAGLHLVEVRYTAAD